jgi:hypothetical protein
MLKNHILPSSRDALPSKSILPPPASLMSPPDAPPQDSFHEDPVDTHMKARLDLDAPSFPLSPPVSPATALARTASTAEPAPRVVRDPILYPHHEAPTAAQPLFTDSRNDVSRDAQSVVDDHVAARSPSRFRSASPPRPGDYALVLEFQSRVASAVATNARRWFVRELGYLEEARGARQYPKIAPARAPPRSHAPAGIRKKAPAAPRAPKAPRPARPPPDPAVRRVQRDDKDFAALPDYCPPLSSLPPDRPAPLKVDWRGAPLDLSQDEHRHLLDPAELALAGVLRLDCATYLTSKRRIFMRRIEALRAGKEFRKTDAQQACKIDVNKASKLWQAFDKVGWLNPTWVAPYV